MKTKYIQNEYIQNWNLLKDKDFENWPKLGLDLNVIFGFIIISLFVMFEST